MTEQHCNEEYKTLYLLIYPKNKLGGTVYRNIVNSRITCKSPIALINSNELFGRGKRFWYKKS